MNNINNIGINRSEGLGGVGGPDSLAAIMTHIHGLGSTQRSGDAFTVNSMYEVLGLGMSPASLKK